MTLIYSSERITDLFKLKFAVFYCEGLIDKWRSKTLYLIPDRQVNTWPHAATAEVPLVPRAAPLRAPAVDESSASAAPAARLMPRRGHDQPG